MKRKIIFASMNHGKVKEVKAMFDDSKYEIISLLDVEKSPLIIEDGSSFKENAFIKADKIFIHKNIPVMADDSGLVVDQLNGAPGIISARFAGEGATDKDNNNKLLSELKSFPQPHKAKYFCAAVFFDGEIRLNSSGELSGRIIDIPAGDNGFGYDPIFVPDGYNITMGQFLPVEKNKISHRYNAFSKLKSMMNKLEL